MTGDVRPYTIWQRLDGLWTVSDALGREVVGIANADRHNAENFVRAQEALAKNPGGTPYVHLFERGQP